MAKILEPAGLHWRPENELIVNTDPTFGKITFAPKTCASIVRVPVELLDDALNLENALTTMFAQSFAKELDRVCLKGASGDGEPVGISNWEGLALTIDLDGGGIVNQTVYLYLGNLLSKIMATGSPAPNAIIMSPEVMAGLETLQSSTYDALRKPGLIGNMQWLSTSALSGGTTSDVYMGYFPNLAIGMRSQLRIKMLDQRYADYYQVAFLAAFRMDVAGIFEESFGLVQNVGHVLSPYS
jgi:HK97 family phage major capsid protein